MENSVRAEITIHLNHKVAAEEGKQAIDRLYKFSIPVGSPWEEAIFYAKEMVKQIEGMQEKAAKLAEENKKKTEVKVEEVAKDVTPEKTK